MARRGDVPSLGVDEREPGDGRPVLTPNARQATAQLSAFRRAEGKPAIEIRKGEVREAAHG